MNKNPCPHPGKYHLSSDKLSIIKPHPQANTCFAREQGYVIARVEPAYPDIAPILLAALNYDYMSAEPRVDVGTAFSVADVHTVEAAVRTLSHALKHWEKLPLEADVPRDDLGTLHLNFSVLAVRVLQILKGLEERCGFVRSEP